MRLVEVVVLMGAHCISPVEHTQTMTEAAKVQCAVVIEKDTDQGTIKVNPEAAAQDPKVAEAVARFQATPADAQANGGTRIVPAFAPAGTPTTTTTPPPAQPKPFGIAAPPPPPAPPAENSASADAASPGGDQPAADQTAEAAPDAAATPDDGSASTEDTADAPAPAPAKKKHAAKAAKPKADQQASARSEPKSEPKTAAAKGGQCSGSATAKWYTTSDGHKKYRCVRSSDAGTAAASPVAEPQPAGSESTRPAAPARPSLFGTYLQSKKVY